MSRVSVFMSSYNYGRYLQASIDSVLQQTFPDFELFILDDASTDDSWEIIRAQTDPRITAMRNPVNRNDKLEMNRIIRELASGDYIAVHHSDNLWEPDKLQKQVDILDTHPEIGAVFTNALIIGENGEPFQDKKHFYYSIFDQPNRSRFEWLNFFFYHANALCHPSILIRKECYKACGYYRNGMVQLPDFDMWVRLCLKYDIHILPEKLIRFRIQNEEKFTSGNLPETHIRSAYEYLKVLDHYKKIDSWEELSAVFPAVQEYYREEGTDIQFVLGILAVTTSKNAFTQLFGLNLVFEALNDPGRLETIARLYDFRQKDFAALTAKYDIFATERFHRINTQLADHGNNIVALAAELDAIKNSRAWRAILFLRRVRALLFRRRKGK